MSNPRAAYDTFTEVVLDSAWIVDMIAPVADHFDLATGLTVQGVGDYVVSTWHNIDSSFAYWGHDNQTPLQRLLAYGITDLLTSSPLYAVIEKQTRTAPIDDTGRALSEQWTWATDILMRLLSAFYFQVASILSDLHPSDFQLSTLSTYWSGKTLVVRIRS